MLYWVRSLKGSWISRLFAAGMMVVFIAWGASSALPLMTGGGTAVAHIGGKPVDISEVQAQYQRALNQAGNPPDLTARQQIAQTALIAILRQHALQLIEHQLGIVAPDAAIRARVYAIPAFQTNGVFDQAKFTQVLQQNSLSPDRFLALEKSNLTDSQLMPALVAGAGPPGELVDQIFAYVTQARTAETVSITTAAQTPPPPPGDAVLKRYWKNHPALFTAPEYRTIKLVILSPEVLAHTEPVSDAEIAALYAQTAATQNQPATRSVQVVTADSAATAAKLAATWKTGADWAAIQADAAKAGAAAVPLDHAQQNQIPNTVLAAAVFSAQPGRVTGPVQGPLGYFVFKVTDANAGGAPPLAQVAAQLKQQIQLQKAQTGVNQDVDNVQDALAGQTPLDKLPGNLGLAAVQGTLDANGNTLDGTPAPIPGGAKLRDAVVKAIFAAHPGDPAQLISGPENDYFAFTIDNITPPAVRPYDQVKSQVAAAWQQDALTRAAETKAAALLAAVNNGQTLDAAASAAGDAVAMSPPVTRDATNGVPSSLVPVLFGLKPGEAAMQQTSDGFLVAVLASISQPKPADDPRDQAEIQQAMAKSLQNDVAESFFGGLQTRDNVKIEPKLFAQIYQ
jgi:peptidyl-prolyl cis-trans isomerase D